MSKVCMKCCFQDWFESSNEKTRRNAKIYYNDMGPLQNTSDADLIPWLGFVPGIHSSSKVGEDEREDTFFFYGEPEAVEFTKKENLKDIGKRELLEWFYCFESYNIIWHPFLTKIVTLLKTEFGMEELYEEYCKRIERSRSS